MPHWPVPMERQSIKLGLERIEEFLKYLDNPHQKTPPIIHVAGTNGKGSTIAKTIGANVGHDYGGKAGQKTEGVIGNIAFAQERLYAHEYNSSFAKSGSHSDAKFWADSMKPSEW